MRYVYSRPDEATDKARKGTELIRTTYTWEMAAQRIFRRLQEIQHGAVDQYMTACKFFLLVRNRAWLLLQLKHLGITNLAK